MNKKMKGVMKRAILIVTAFFCLGVLPCLASPVAQVKSRVHRFPSVKEGTQISHTFVVKNTGDQELKILNVLPP